MYEAACAWLLAFLLTAAAEAALVLLLGLGSRGVIASLLGNLMTNPLLNLLLAAALLRGGISAYRLVLVLGELSAVLTEAAVYRSLLELSRRRAVLLSLSANCLSFLLGSVL